MPISLTFYFIWFDSVWFGVVYRFSFFNFQWKEISVRSFVGSFERSSVYHLFFLYSVIISYVRIIVCLLFAHRTTLTHKNITHISTYTYTCTQAHAQKFSRQKTYTHSCNCIISNDIWPNIKSRKRLLMNAKWKEICNTMSYESLSLLGSENYYFNKSSQYYVSVIL